MTRCDTVHPSLQTYRDQVQSQTETNEQATPIVGSAAIEVHAVIPLNKQPTYRRVLGF
jgi:hypothetical protein